MDANDIRGAGGPDSTEPPLGASGPAGDAVPDGAQSAEAVPAGAVPTDVELARLRARVAQLEVELAERAAPPPAVVAAPRPPRARWRAVVATVLIVIGCLLAPLSVVAVWASQQVSDTERYVETVAPLADDPAVQAAVTDAITRQIFERVDVEAIVRDAVVQLEDRGLPEQFSSPLGALAVPIADGVEGFAHDKIADIVAGERFAAAWEQANRIAHEQVVNVLSGEQGGTVSAQDGAIVVNLGPFVAEVKERLVAEGFGLAARIPEVNATVTVFQSEEITRVQQGYRLLESLGTWLPYIALAFLGLGVYVAKSHRRALVGAALGVFGAMLALGVVLALARVGYLDALPENVPEGAASSVFDTLVRFLRQALRAVAVAGLVVALIAFLTGGSVTAVRTRALITRGIGSMRSGAEAAGLRTGPVGTWVYANRRGLRIAVATLAAAVITLWTNPTVTVVLWVAAIALVLLAVVEFLGRPPGAVAEPAEPSEPPEQGATAEAGTGSDVEPATGSEPGLVAEPEDDVAPRPVVEPIPVAGPSPTARVDHGSSPQDDDVPTRPARR